MPKCTELPFDILDNILQRLSKKDNKQCSLTCRAWRSTSQRVLFHDLKLTSAYTLRGTVERLLAARSHNCQHPSPGDYVKTLSFHMGDFDIALIEKAFPFLEVIFIGRNPMNDELCQVLIKGGFPNLKKIPFTELNLAHLKVILARTKHIKELELHHTSLDKKMRGMIRVFPFLHRLELLKLRFSCNKVKIGVEEVLPKVPPTLKSIVLASASKFILNHLETSNTLPLPNVKEVHIFHQNTLLLHGDISCSYIMEKFPNVEVLDIRTNNYNKLWRRNGTASTEESLSQFFVYLFNIKKLCNVYPIITDKSTARVVENFFRYFLVQKSQTHAKLENHLKIGYDVRTRNQRDNSAKSLAYIKAINKYCGDVKVCEINVVYRSKSKDKYQPWLELFRRVGNMYIDCLTIGEGIWGDHRKPAALDVIFNHFTDLKRLRICNNDKVTFSEDLEDQTKSTLEELEFYQTDLKLKFFPRISTKCPNLKSLKINICRFMYHNQRGNFRMRQLVPINMPSTRLEKLHFIISLDTDFDEYCKSKAFIRLKTATKQPKYFKIVLKNCHEDSDEEERYHEFGSRQGRYTEADYNSYLKDIEYIVYDVYCEAVDKMVVEYEILPQRSW